MSVVKKLISFDSVVAEELETLSKTLDITQKELIERALKKGSGVENTPILID